MKGTIFVEFFDLVESAHGLDMVDQIIEATEQQLKTGGAYTVVGNYPHEELLALATTLSNLSGNDMKDILGLFATQLMNAFTRMHPEFFTKSKDVFDFLMSVDQHIHADVRKIYPDANPPLVTGEILENGSMLLNYQSSRPFAELALALALASGEHFDQPLAAEIVARGEDEKSICIKLSKA